MDRSEVMIPSVSMAISVGYDLRSKQQYGSLDMEGCPDVSFKACDSFIIYGYPLHCSRVFRLYKSVFFFFAL
ncbi:hypothetical protein Peur_027846 [Populus x canadensis]